MKAKTFNEIPKGPRAKSFSKLMKANPYHDRLGRFTTASGVGGAGTVNIKALKAQYGVTDVNLQETKDSQKFANAIKAAKESNPNGGSVDEHPIEELNTYKKFLSADGMAGVAVKQDGDITAVFKNTDLKEHGVVNDLILTARANGGDKMDCYGRRLVNMYEQCGYVPVAKVKFNADYVDDPVLLKTKPDVYVMMKNTDSIETAVRKNAEKSYKKSSKIELDNLPDFEYDDALSYRDSLLAKQEGK